MIAGKGDQFEIRRTTAIVDPSHTFASRYLSDMVKNASGMRLPYYEDRPGNSIVFEKALPSQVKKEGYTLDSNENGVTIRYGDEAGAFYAVQTLRQLLPASIESTIQIHNMHWTVPSVHIEDEPRFSWRGMHLDVSRHFFPVDFIKRYIDYIAMMKMNVFHWHLVDDGGWRIQIDKYPKLTSVGAWRYGVTTNWDQGLLRFDPESKLPKYGGFYTKEEVKDIVRYAADRSITIVPEIEMPGHAMPIFAAYPELQCKNQPPSGLQGQPPTNVYCPGKEETFKFVEDVLTEVMDMFPSKWIHIGGDEVDKTYWHRCPDCQARMKSEGLKDEEALQSYFVQRVDKFLSSKGRRLIGWDEILEGGLAQGATVMSWRGIDGGIAAAQSGHDVVMSPTSHCYFDYLYDGMSTEHVYTFEPIPSALDADQQHFVLGGQANVWTERIPNRARVEYMIFPRMIAMAETLWSPKEGRDLNEFMDRLTPYFTRLDNMHANYYLPAPRTDVTAVVFSGSSSVTAISPKAMVGTLRYTLDGTNPTSLSPAYTGPISVDQTTDVKLAYVSNQGRVGDVTTVSMRKAVGDVASATIPGWNMARYEGAWSRVPDFSKLTAASSGPATSMGIASDEKDEHFALHYDGYIKVDQDGDYQFSLFSDDGSWLKVGGATVINHDGLHGPGAKLGTVRLTKGFHQIEVGYFQGGGAASLALTMKGPGEAAMHPVDGSVYRR